MRDADSPSSPAGFRHADGVCISVEDCFAILDASSPDRLFATEPLISNLGQAVRGLEPTWRFVWDLREAEDVYWDVLDGYRTALREWPARATRILASPANVDTVQDAVERLQGAEVVCMRPRPLSGTWFPLDLFVGSDELGFIGDLEQQASLIAHQTLGLNPDGRDYEEWDRLDGTELMYEIYQNLLNKRRTNTLAVLLDRIAEHSVLTQMAISLEGDRVFVTPYHSHSLHTVPTRADELVLVRPGRASQRHWKTFETALRELEALLNDPRTNERDIERLLIRHPLFLKGLNYQTVYSQVILPQGDGRSLRPDVIAEPIDSEWATIMDLKLPSEPLLVGRPGRARLAHGIHSVVAQLREYAGFFDDRRAAKRVEDRYGFKCYKPRLVAIVGRDPSQYSPEETRRAMTSCPDVELITYDRLLDAARQLLLL